MRCMYVADHHVSIDIRPQTNPPQTSSSSCPRPARCPRPKPNGWPRRTGRNTGAWRGGSPSIVPIHHQCFFTPWQSRRQHRRQPRALLTWTRPPTASSRSIIGQGCVLAHAYTHNPHQLTAVFFIPSIYSGGGCGDRRTDIVAAPLDSCCNSRGPAGGG